MPGQMMGRGEHRAPWPSTSGLGGGNQLGKSGYRCVDGDYQSAEKISQPGPIGETDIQ
jgi:hypothetical protein